jgi:dynein heavy chain
MRGTIECLPADVFVSCACISYNGPFSGTFRKELVDRWVGLIKMKELPISENYQITKTLGDPIVMREWIIEGLPSDTVSVENAIFATEGHRWPLMIDPQEQASKWLQKLLRKSKLKLTKLTESNFTYDMIGAIKNGYPVLLQDLEDSLPAVLDSVLGKEIQIIDNLEMVKFGTDTINYDPQFKLFMVTKASNPNFLPEIFIKVNIINFTVTFEGLQEQLLAMVVKNEREEVEK